MPNVDFERSVLGSILLDNSCLRKLDLSAEHFALDSHRRIYARMAGLDENGQPIDYLTLTDALTKQNELEGVGGVPYCSSLVDFAFPENLQHHARAIREAAALRKIAHGADAVAKQASHASANLAQIKTQLTELSASIAGYELPAEHGLFHSYQDFVSAPPLRFAINGFLQRDGVTMIGGLSGHGKTLIMLSMVRALLEGTPLFGYRQFHVDAPADRVIYMIPESSAGPFWHRLKLFHLDEHVKTGKLLTRTLSSPEALSLTDARFLAEVQGAHVFLDTAVRFMDGDENAANEAKGFAQVLFAILAAGAATITGAHHSPKGFESAEYMTLENALRGSGDIGAMLTTCWGIKQTDAERNQIYVQNLKPRDFEPCPPFILEGRPHIDETGNFKILAEPGQAGELRDHQKRSKPGPKSPANDAELQERAQQLSFQGRSIREIAAEMHASKSVVERWLGKR